MPPQNLEGKDTPEGGRLSWYYADATNLRGFYVYRTLSTTSPLEQVSGLMRRILNYPGMKYDVNKQVKY